MGLFGKLKESLKKTRESLANKVEGLIYGRTQVDEEFYEDLEEILIQADVGVQTSLELVERVRSAMQAKKWDDPRKLHPMLKEYLREILVTREDVGLKISGNPAVIMIVGVNGTGKTTSIGKLAYKLKNEGRKVLLAAADTFRAAAIDQLEVWGRRAGVDVIKHQPGSDPAAVVYDAIQAAKARGYDVIIVDTAGRLHTKSNLMDELNKIYRVIGRELPGQPEEVLLVLDATTGHNAVNQAELFGKSSGVTGIILTKLDGTAKGGIVVAIKQTLQIPVKLVGTGEKIDDLAEFNSEEFVEGLLGSKQ
ncbi:MAG: signal recognition particle-docking protein FtsY [Peptococcaceae bacterium]|nr:signal recognition particle-docking protein FtsY [Peptococcaceae bacterium]